MELRLQRRNARRLGLLCGLIVLAIVSGAFAWKLGYFGTAAK